MSDRHINLTQGKVAVVDEEDFGFLSRNNWYFSMGYAQRQTQKDYVRTTIAMHNVIAARMGHSLTGLEVDHDDRDGLNNRRSNLIIGTHSQNMQNRGLQKNNTSGHRGVTWFDKTGKWKVEITSDSRNIFVGYFDDIETAVRARRKAELRIFGREIV